MPAAYLNRRLLRGMVILALMLTAVVAGFAGEVRAQVSGCAGQSVAQIRVEGNLRVETDAILLHINQKAGEPCDSAVVDDDIKTVYKMGFFDDVSARLEKINGATVLAYVVKERPQVTDVKFEGMKAIRPTDDKIVAATKLHPGAIYDPILAKETVNGVTKVYEDRGYLDATVTFRAILQPDNTEVAVFDVKEGPKVQITQIKFVGNKTFSDAVLQGVMETHTHNFLSFITGAGALDKSKLQDDVEHLKAFYYDSGFLNVSIADPKVTREGDKLTILIEVDEGEAYRFGRITIAGNLRFPRRELTPLVTIKPGQRFEGSAMQHVVLSLSDFYSNRGYAFVNVDPRTRLDPAQKRINVTFYVTPGHEVLINRIIITGNTKTSDKVIRREMQLQEQEPYSAEAIRDSKIRLDRLGFFNDVRITTEPSSQPDKVNLNVSVSERSTAMLQLAGGFDSYSSVFGNFTLGNTNLFGGGESLILNAQVGFLFQNFSISYVEPWFLDIPLSVGLQLFDTKAYLLSFNQSAAGFTLTTNYPLTELGFKKVGPLSLKDVTAGLGYQFQSVGITGLSPDTTFQIERYKGYTQTSELLPSIQRFTVDNRADPRSGTVMSLNGQIGGLGGGNYFLKAVTHGRYYWSFLKSPTWGNWVLSQGITFGIGTNLSSGSGGNLPLYERFFPGGVGGPADVRGYQLYSLGPLVTIFNAAGQPVSVQNIGGSKELIFSNEITFPILSGLGLRGVIFSDAGQSYTLQQGIDFQSLQASYGIGVRWKSPFGPLAIDIARPINPRPADQSTVFELGTGAPL